MTSSSAAGRERRGQALTCQSLGHEVARAESAVVALILDMQMRASVVWESEATAGSIADGNPCLRVTNHGRTAGKRRCAFCMLRDLNLKWSKKPTREAHIGSFNEGDACLPVSIRGELWHHACMQP